MKRLLTATLLTATMVVTSILTVHASVCEEHNHTTCDLQQHPMERSYTEIYLSVDKNYLLIDNVTYLFPEKNTIHFTIVIDDIVYQFENGECVNSYQRTL